MKWAVNVNQAKVMRTQKVLIQFYYVSFFP